MNRIHFPELTPILVALFFFAIPAGVLAQNLLQKPVSFTANRQPLALVLRTLGDQNGFNFSYNSDLLPGDSLITAKIEDQPLRHALQKLLGSSYAYKETGNYIIILRGAAERTILIAGVVHDIETQEHVPMASVYSRNKLISTMTGEDGTFRIRLKSSSFPIDLWISRMGYTDTLIQVAERNAENTRVGLRQRTIKLDEVAVYNSDADRNWLNRLFVSTRLREQSRNIGEFFVALPYQVSLTPGLGTQGKMSTQIVNKFSLNLLGGYSGGVDGFEMAGVFNIAKQDVQYVQVAGVFNQVAGSVRGLQMAGLYSDVYKELNGVQASGLGNRVASELTGLQIAGLFNQVNAGISGLQAAGIVNLTKTKSRGIQIAGAFNRSRATFTGVQVSGALNMAHTRMNGWQVGVVNYARNLSGVQVGLINVADSIQGLSIGLFNFVRKGKGEVSVFSTEIAPWNLAWKTGSRKVYTILTAGTSAASEQKILSMALGLGTEFNWANGLISTSVELGAHTVYTGSWENTANVGRLQVLAGLRPLRRLSIQFGPALTTDFDPSTEKRAGFRTIPYTSYPNFEFGKSGVGWLGWQAGLTWNYAEVPKRKPNKK